MTYPYSPESGFPLPSVLEGVRNGEIPDGVLFQLPAPAKGRMIAPSARAYAALQAAYKAAVGRELGTTSAADAYRSRANQVGAFMKRYQPIYNPVTCTMDDGRLGPDGKRWYKHRGVAALAGFDKNGNVRSLHGLGIAADLKDMTGRLNSAWLEANAAKYGFKKSSPKEPWHWFYTTGDSIPQAVLDYEKGHKPVVPPPIDKPVLRLGSQGEDVKIVQRAVGATPDGDFGPVTQKRVIAFQQAHGLTADGIVGPQTWKYIL
jgi:hypothetical protein